ncbi:hypothetical protein HZ992_12430 [Rhizobacter sp. AJA081-3]|uniref:hypothetical protein n=1 Tax=Rhizobacter sp. AJA081-3 TaxID=2753607 RepID=UPI001ADF1B2C|nr:hypothetical protein [Rhizobacter sp. AJA081-3]QTN25703.1 hypothetical protein HZ992_12430 [Rhizobacter sp. AJA081-3]
MGRVSFEDLGGGDVRVSARVLTDGYARGTTSLKLVVRSRAMPAATMATLDIDARTGFGQKTLRTSESDGRALSHAQWLELAGSASLADPSGRELMQGAVGNGAQRLIDDLSIAGIQRFLAQNNVRDVKTLMEALPPFMRASYTLVEKSRSLQTASVTNPRIILFGGGSRLLMGIATDPDSPTREHIEVGELLADGTWNFKAINVTTNQADGSACAACHGAQPRPIWKEYNQWPGMFGNDGDGMTLTQLQSMRRIHATQATSDRFRVLPMYAYAGDKDSFYLPFRDYGYTNFNITLELSQAVATGVYRRIRSHSNYPTLKAGLVLADCDAAFRTDARPGWVRFRTAMAAAGQTRYDLPAVLKALGIADPVTQLQVQNRADEVDPTKGVGYFNSNSDTHHTTQLLVINDLAREMPAVRDALSRLTDQHQYGLRQTNMLEDLRERLVQLVGVTGEVLQAERHHPSVIGGWERVAQGFLSPAKSALCSAVADN